MLGSSLDRDVICVNLTRQIREHVRSISDDAICKTIAKIAKFANMLGPSLR